MSVMSPEPLPEYQIKATGHLSEAEGFRVEVELGPCKVVATCTVLEDPQADEIMATLISALPQAIDSVLDAIEAQMDEEEPTDG